MAGFWIVVALGIATACTMATAASSSVIEAEPFESAPTMAPKQAIPTAVPTAIATATPIESSTVTGRCQQAPVSVADFGLTATGDFDGDGRSDELYLQGSQFPLEAGVTRADLSPASLAVAFGDGGFAIGPLGAGAAGEAEEVRQVRSVVDVIRPVGLGHDVIVIDEPGLSGPYASRLAIVNLYECTPEIIGWLSAGASVSNQLGWCIATTERGDVIRTFQTRTTELQHFGALEDRHLVWDGSQLTDLVPTVPVAEPLCGQTLVPFIDLSADHTVAAPLSGDHGLSLQWIGGDSSIWGTLRFAANDDGTTYRVAGRQSDEHLADPQGSWVQIAGTIEQISDLELRFDGVIESRVPYLNDGEPCIRSGEQTFLSTQGRGYWRLQDLLNCDGHTTDYIDIYF